MSNCDIHFFQGFLGAQYCIDSTSILTKRFNLIEKNKQWEPKIFRNVLLQRCVSHSASFFEKLVLVQLLTSVYHKFLRRGSRKIQSLLYFPYFSNSLGLSFNSKSLQTTGNFLSLYLSLLLFICQRNLDQEFIWIFSSEILKLEGHMLSVTLDQCHYF